jgi:TldD protein
MIDNARAAVEAALGRGAQYADARAGRVITEELVMRNGRLGSASAPESVGIGVRVLVDGGWGFAAVPGRNRSAVDDATRRAVELARACAPARVRGVQLAGEGGERGEYRTPRERDPFTVPLTEKLALLENTDDSMRGASETVVRESSVRLRREEQWQVTSEGGETYQDLLRSGAGISTSAAAHGTLQRRSWPASFGGNYLAAGWEHVESLDLAAHGEQMRDESVALCSAEPCPAGVRDLLLMGNQLMLQIHESVGHPSELDRVHGHEVDLAGSSFATPDLIDRFRYGSPIVNLIADSTVPGGLDTRGFDDDGVRSGRWPIVEEGIFRGYHDNREWAAETGAEASRGANRAEGWFHPPIIRMTNLSLLPGDWTLDALIADTEEGVLCEGVKMWSIDQRRLNFQFTTEIGWEIEGGRKGRMLRSPTYQGVSPEFWNSCDAICDEAHWQLWGVPNCGKGNPMQVAEMSHGAAPARFRKVTFLR